MTKFINFLYLIDIEMFTSIDRLVTFRYYIAK